MIDCERRKKIPQFYSPFFILIFIQNFLVCAHTLLASKGLSAIASSSEVEDVKLHYIQSATGTHKRKKRVFELDRQAKYKEKVKWLK